MPNFITLGQTTYKKSIISTIFLQIEKQYIYAYHAVTTNGTRMWANAQCDGRPAKHRWRPLFNAAKFGWRPLLHCESKKTRHYNIVHNFAKSWPIFKFFSPTDSLVNMQQNRH